MIIYKITNKLNGMVYIGQTKNSIETRWKAHCANRNSKILSCKLYQAINEFGKTAFTVEQIDVAATKDEADEKEMYWISFYDAIEKGYNTSPGGRYGGNRRKVMSVEDGMVFDTMTEAAKHYNRSVHSIEQALKKPHLTCAGKHWKTV